MKKYLAITFLGSWLLWLPSLLSSAGIIVPDILLAIGMLASFVPSFAGLYVIYSRSGRTGLHRLWQRITRLDFNKRWLFPTLLLMPVAAAISFFLTLLITGDNDLNITMGTLFTIVTMFFIGGPLGEEIGWRGFLLEHLLSRYRALKAGLIVGIIWGLWHLPLHFISDSTQEYVPIWADLLLMILVSMFFTWIFVNTRKNLLLAMLFHWSINTSVILFPYWQLGSESIDNLPNLWQPTPGMLIGFGVLLIIGIVVVMIFGRHFTKNGNITESQT